VAVGAFRHRTELQAKSIVIVVAILTASVVLLGFVVDLARNDPRSLVAAIVLVVLAFVAQLAVEASQRRGSAASGKT
jgi:hypothetical protein